MMRFKTRGSSSRPSAQNLQWIRDYTMLGGLRSDTFNMTVVEARHERVASADKVFGSQTAGPEDTHSLRTLGESWVNLGMARLRLVAPLAAVDPSVLPALQRESVLHRVECWLKPELKVRGYEGLPPNIPWPRDNAAVMS